MNALSISSTKTFNNYPSETKASQLGNDYNPTVEQERRYGLVAMPGLTTAETTRTKQKAIELNENPANLSPEETKLLRESIRVGQIYDEIKFDGKMRPNDFCNHASIRYLANLAQEGGPTGEEARNVLAELTGKPPTGEQIRLWSQMSTMEGEISQSSYDTAVREVRSESLAEAGPVKTISPEEYTDSLNRIQKSIAAENN